MWLLSLQKDPQEVRASVEVQVYPGSGLPKQQEEMSVLRERVSCTSCINLENILLCEGSQS